MGPWRAKVGRAGPTLAGADGGPQPRCPSRDVHWYGEGRFAQLG
jgi:hypothetical protein